MEVQSLQSASEWPQIVFETSRDQSSQLEEALFASGALSVQYQDLLDEPVLEPAPGEIRLWDNIRLTGMYASDVDTDAVLLQLKMACDGALPPHRWVPLANREWERVWMERFQPMQFGAGLWICPTHCDPVDPTVVNVKLDPGLAFGTGTHETTRLCLEWLGANQVEGRVFDYGCGSGVLAVAAALLGASSVVAADIDPQAVTATKANALGNGVLDQLSIGHPDEFLTDTADLVLANILYQPLLELAPALADIARPGAVLVMSGILLEQVDGLMLRYNEWFSFRKTEQRGSWALLEAVRNGT